ncbi:MAG: translation initiation factor IF-1 [Candidatus Berkelbacteria bacterium Licking1014_7]|uniref:Translation initiation factor IF-1 n=1 Tax=Candidatus Berkelbacteria bacterium Licking1014_7 TaxID=2017147 RepID=A0A554LI53_9BACT|nr:MAG: translation initiation factor IF-1 [Candidatus Berkelbacteria bacterium Licking1014_7]
MPQEDKIKFQGRVIEALPDVRFRVELESGQEIIAYLAGKMRLHYIKLVEGDSVLVEMSPYDLTKGRIIRRL